MSEYEDQLAAMRAATDQMVGLASEMAKSFSAFFHGLCEQGLTREEALAAAMNWQTATLHMPPLPEDE